MKKIINNWQHTPGKHCGSTALSDLMNFYNVKLTEETCFGLGAGLGFFYVKGEIFNPTHAIMTRSATLEADFFNNMGIPFTWKIEKDNQKALKIVENFIDNNLPVLLQTDIYYIDYYKSSTHFNGHVVVQWGYDKKEKKAFLSDTHWQGLQELAYESLQKARTSKSPPIILENNYFEVKKINPDLNMTNLIKNALRRQATGMLSNSDDDNGFIGIGGMKNAAKDMVNWKEAKDWKWCARFSYQVIERRGTGGGAFRLMYSKFIRESEEYLPSLKTQGMADRMLQIATRWTELSVTLKKISDSEKPEGLDYAGEKMADLSSLEESFYKDILKIIEMEVNCGRYI